MDYYTQVVLDKFSNCSPAYRQSQNYSYSKINYSRQTICDWYSCASDLVSGLVELMFKRMLESDYLMADETPVKLLNMSNKSNGGQGHILLIKQGGQKFNYVYSTVIESRTQEVISGKLKKFNGHLQTDGLSFYAGLHNREGIIGFYCWSHARRKFTDIIKLSGKLEGIAFEAYKKINTLYKIERKGKELSLKELLKLRQKESVPILNEIRTYLSSHKDAVPPKSKISIAINYVLARWEGFIEYTKDARLSIDNNSTEQCIKIFSDGTEELDVYKQY